MRKNYKNKQNKKVHEKQRNAKTTKEREKIYKQKTEDVTDTKQSIKEHKVGT